MVTYHSNSLDSKPLEKIRAEERGWIGTKKWRLTGSQSLHGDRGVGHGVGVAGGLDVLGLASRPVLVVRMVLHVLGPDALGLVNEGSLLRLRQRLPLAAEAL